ncbi:MAG: CvpA family protein [bacterium]|nr:CvpA family protein [bacterium]
MIIIDLIASAIGLISVILGLVKGLIKQVGALSSLVVAFILANRFYLNLSLFLAKHIQMGDPLLRVISFIILFAILFLLLWLVVILIGKATENTPIVIIDKLLGVLFSIGLALLIYGGLIYLSTKLPFKEDVLKNIKSTYTYRVFNFVATSDIIRHGK